jgi:DNA polymerase V
MYQINIKIKTKFISRHYLLSKAMFKKSLKSYKPKPVEKFCVRIAGESMVNAGLFPGAVVEITKNLHPCHNDIILAKVNGVHTIKRLFINHDNTYTLMPENMDYEPIHVDLNCDFEIEGVVTRVVR